ncbi:hypothetical protein ACFL2U_00285 [Patescibacteria group bacterium]
MDYKLSKKEIRFILIISLFLIILTSIPFIYGYLNKGELTYTGLHKLAPIDGALYFSYLEQIQQGNWLIDILYTNEADYLLFFNLFWLVIGLIGKVLSLTPVLTFHLFRILLILFFVYVVFKFLKLVLPDVNLKLKKIFLLFIIFSAGWGGFWSLFFPNKEFSPLNFNFPMDLFVPEANSFLILFYSPHFILSLSLIIYIFYWFLRAIWQRKISYAVLSGILGLFLFNFHPFYFITVYSVIFFYLITMFVIKRKIIWYLIWYYLILFLVSFPSVGYYLYFLITNSNFQIKSAQNNSLSPSAIYFFISYGFSLILAIFTMAYLVEQKKLNKRNLFLFVWFWIGVILIYGPFNFQRRLTEGWQIPLSILACAGIFIVWQFIKKRWPKIKNIYVYPLLSVIILIFSFTNIVFLYKDLGYLQAKSQYAYLQPDLVSALVWYEQQTDFEQTLLCSAQKGNIIPGQIARRVYLGHEVETINFNEKYEQVKWFFNTNSEDEQKINFLANAEIDYMLYSDTEKKLGEYNPLDKEYLQLVYENEQVKIFQVSLNLPDQ